MSDKVTVDSNDNVSVEDIGSILPVEKNKLYIVLEMTGDGEGFACGVIDRLDHTNEDHQLLAIIARGMIDYAITNTEAIVDAGVHAFKVDNATQKVGHA